MTPLTRLKLYKGDALDELVESFSGFTDLVVPPPPTPPAPVVGRYRGNVVTIADGDTQPLTWDTLDSGADLLDLTNPAAPTAKVAGFYVVAAVVRPNGPMTLGGWYEAILRQLGTPLVAVTEDSPPGLTQARVTLTVPGLLPQGQPIDLTVTNNDGVAARDFFLLTSSVAVIPNP